MDDVASRKQQFNDSFYQVFKLKFFFKYLFICFIFKKIFKEKESGELESLQLYLTKSNEYTNKMTNILNTFENKLTSLQDLIMPVYISTNDLQTKFTSKSTTNRQIIPMLK